MKCFKNLTKQDHSKKINEKKKPESESHITNNFDLQSDFFKHLSTVFSALVSSDVT